MIFMFLEGVFRFVREKILLLLISWVVSPLPQVMYTMFQQNEFSNFRSDVVI